MASFAATACAAGTFSAAGATGCTPCAPGDPFADRLIVFFKKHKLLKKKEKTFEHLRFDLVASHALVSLLLSVFFIARDVRCGQCRECMRWLRRWHHRHNSGLIRVTNLTPTSRAIPSTMIPPTSKAPFSADPHISHGFL